VSSALKALGALHVPEAVEVLVSKLPEYPTSCLYWLGTYASAVAVNAVVEYLDNEDPSLRCEAAEALARLPDPREDDEDYVASLVEALSNLGIAIADEEDEAVLGELEDAWAHVASLVLQAGAAASE
jgi:HEAT repeat protein